MKAMNAHAPIFSQRRNLSNPVDGGMALVLAAPLPGRQTPFMPDAFAQGSRRRFLT